MLEWIQGIDWAILNWIQEVFRCEFLDFVVPKITALGNKGTIWLVLALALTISKKYRKYGIAMFAALAVGALIGNVMLKPLVARSRPCWQIGRAHV